MKKFILPVFLLLAIIHLSAQKFKNLALTPPMEFYVVVHLPVSVDDGGDLLQLDDLTFRLLTNEEALNVNQKSMNNHEIRTNDNEVIWAADDPETSAKYVALFNLNDDIPRRINVSWDEHGISGEYVVRNLLFYQGTTM